LLLGAIAEVGVNQLELFQGRTEVFGDLDGDDIRVGEVGGIFLALVLEPKEVKAGLVAGGELFSGVGWPATGGVVIGPGRLASVTIVGIAAGNEIVELVGRQRIGFEGDVDIGAEVVDLELLGPGIGAGRLLIEEEDVGLDALGVEDAGGQAQQRVDVARFEELAANGLAGATLEEDVIGDDNGSAAVGRQQAVDVLHEV